MEKNYTYEITENGYYILINGKKVIYQDETHIADSSKSYEENAIAQIEELKQAELQEIEEKTEIEQLQEQITDLQLALAEIYESEV